MILQITLRHSFFGGQTKEVLYIGPRELGAGADIASHFRESERAMFSPFTASYVDDDTIEIICRDKCERYSVWKDGWFRTPTFYRPRTSVQVEGETYDNDHEVDALVQLMPHIQPCWNMLKASCGNESAMFRRELLEFGVDLDDEALWGKRYNWLKNFRVIRVKTSSLTLRLLGRVDSDITLDCYDTPEVEDNGLIFSLVSQTVIINEWDTIEDKPLSIHVDSGYLKESETDSTAAYLIALCVQEQYPEALDVVAGYMRKAHELGSADAEAWLDDHVGDD